jgi:hypothetical protein
MKLLSKMPTCILMSMMLSASAWSQTDQSQLPDEFERDITEGKVIAAEASFALEKNLSKSIDEKQIKAIHLINAVGAAANDRFSSDRDKGDLTLAYGGFITRFQAIREDREALEKRLIVPDTKALKNYSERLDRLIRDLQKFLK